MTESRYRIIIDVSYDDTTVSTGMASLLEENVMRCVERHELLNDHELEMVVDTWRVKVEEVS